MLFSSLSNIRVSIYTLKPILYVASGIALSIIIYLKKLRNYHYPKFYKMSSLVVRILTALYT
jgi:hypothetical protein